MPILETILCVVLLAPVAAFVIALILAVRSKGRKRWLAWGNLVLMLLPLLVGIAGGALLAEKQLAWRSSVRMSCGLVFTAGILALFIRAGVFLTCRAEKWSPVLGTLASCFIALAGFLLCAAVVWYGLLFSAMWSGSDRVVTVRGECVVEEQDWDDWTYYAYHGPFVRSSGRLYSKQELGWEDFGETEK